MLPFQNNPKDLDPSCRMDLDLLDCFGRKITLSYNRRNMAIFLFKLFLSGKAVCYGPDLDSNNIFALTQFVSNVLVIKIDRIMF